MGRRTGGLVCGAQWGEGGGRGGGVAGRGRQVGDCSPWAATPQQGQCWAQGMEGRASSGGESGPLSRPWSHGCLVPGAGAQNQGRWQVRTTEATGQGHSLVSGSAGPTWWPGRQGDSSEGDSSAASPRQVLTFWPQRKDRHGGTAYTRTRQETKSISTKAKCSAGTRESDFRDPE